MEYTPPPLFNRGPTPLVRLLICSLLSIGLLVADARYQYLDGVRRVVAVVVYPLQRLAGTPAATFDRIGDFFVRVDHLSQLPNGQVAGPLIGDERATQRARDAVCVRRVLGGTETPHDAAPRLAVVRHVNGSGADVIADGGTAVVVVSQRRF